LAGQGAVLKLKLVKFVLEHLASTLDTRLNGGLPKDIENDEGERDNKRE